MMNKEHRLTNEEVNSKTSEIIIPCSIFKTYSKFVLFLVFLCLRGYSYFATKSQIPKVFGTLSLLIIIILIF